MSSTDGSSTSTGWKRRSSAASFSMCLRYSSSVVAPTARSSPRASIGLSRLAASTAPSAAPAPTIVCSSSRNSTTWPPASWTSFEHGLQALLELAAVLRAGQQRADVQRDDAAVAQRLGDVAGDDALGEALDDRGLADAGLADEHGVVLRAAAEDLDDAADLVVAADDRIELAVVGLGGEVAAVALERLDLLLGRLVGDRARAHLGERLQQALVGRAVGGQRLAGGAVVARRARAGRARRRRSCPSARASRARRRAGSAGPRAPSWARPRSPASASRRARTPDRRAGPPARRRSCRART